MELATFEYKEKEIGGRIFKVRAMPPLKALELLGDLQAVFTTGLDGKITADGQDDKSLFDKDINAGAIIAGIGKNLKGPALVGFAQRLINEDFVNVKEQGQEEYERVTPAKFNNIFTGSLKNMFLLMHFVLEVNYGDFFESVPSLTGLVEVLGTKR